MITNSPDWRFVYFRTLLCQNCIFLVPFALSLSLRQQLIRIDDFLLKFSIYDNLAISILIVNGQPGETILFRAAEKPIDEHQNLLPKFYLRQLRTRRKHTSHHIQRKYQFSMMEAQLGPIIVPESCGNFAISRAMYVLVPAIVIPTPNRYMLISLIFNKPAQLAGSQLATFSLNLIQPKQLRRICYACCSICLL